MNNITGKLFYVESDDCIYMHVTKVSVTYRQTHSHTEMHTHICIYYDDDNEPCGLIQPLDALCFSKPQQEGENVGNKLSTTVIMTEPTLGPSTQHMSLCGQPTHNSCALYLHPFCTLQAKHFQATKNRLLIILLCKMHYNRSFKTITTC